MKKIYLLIAMLLSSSFALLSQEINFTNGEPANANWSSPLNWSTGFIPTTTSIVNQESSATSFVDVDFTIVRLQNLTSTGGTRLINSINGAVLSINSGGNNSVAIQNRSNNGVKLGIRGKININNSTPANFSRVTNFGDASTGNAANSIEFEGTSLLTLTTPFEVFKTAHANGANNFFFNGKIEGNANFRVAGSTTATFGNSVSNAGYTGQIVLTGGTIVVNTADNVVFYDGPKIQVNTNGSTLTLNGVNVFKSSITVGGTPSNNRTMNLNIDKNQNGFKAITLITTSILNMDIDPSVTEVAFEKQTNTWETGTINITGFKDGVIRFGTDNTGLTSTQLSQITVDDDGNGLFLDNNGYLYSYDTAWTGAVDSDWNDAGNWSNGIPDSGQDVYIPEVTNAPIIDGTTGVVLGDLIIEETDGLTINAEGSLIVNGASSGTINHKVNVSNTAWHLVSSPVTGAAYNSTWMTANEVASGTNNNIGISTYQNGTLDTDTDGVGPDTATGPWVYVQSTDSGTFGTGTGYSLKKANAAVNFNYTFSGTYTSGTVSPTITQNVSNWNLIGNPYSAYIDVDAFLTANSTPLSDAFESLYVWNGSSYQPLTSGYIHPGQGFFVNAASASTTVDFTAAMASHQTGQTFYKSNNTSVNLTAHNGSYGVTTYIDYIDGKTKGLDPRFDLGLFDGVNSDLRIYTHLIENSQGINFYKQALPNTDFESLVVPVGVKAAAGKEITFTAEALNLPGDVKVFIEDRETNTITRLDQANASYKVTLNDALNGTGRFFLHTKASGVLSTDEVVLQNTSIYAINNNTLRVVGLPSGNANVKMYSILGKQVMQTSFSSTGVKEISLPKLSTGMYIVQVETATGKLNKKIVLE